MDITGSLLNGKFKLKRLLAQGGSADVYVASALGETSHFAIKVLPAEDGADRFVKREVATLKKLDHPNIVRFIEDGFDGDINDGVYFIVLELIEGSPIDKYFLQEIPLHTRLQLFLQLLDAIAYAHGRNVIHRDIKPGNVYVVEEGTEAKVKVLDFGIAAVTDTISPQRTVQGYFSDLFASPEQVQWEGFTPATDVFSFCVLLLYLLAGKEAQDQSRQQRNREILVSAARRTLGENEAGQKFLALLQNGIAHDPKKRPPLDMFRRAISELRHQTTELRELVIYITPKFAERIEIREDYPGAAKAYIRNALRDGGGLAHFKLLPKKDTELKQGLSVGNDASGLVFRGFFDENGGYIILHAESKDSETDLHYLNEEGVSYKIEPLVFNSASEARKATSDHSLDDLYDSLEIAFLKSKQARSEHQDRKNNQTFGIWRKIIDLKQIILDEEKIPIRYKKYTYEHTTNTLTLTLAESVDAGVVDFLINEEIPLTISIGNNQRKKHTRQMSCGHAIRSVQKEGVVSEITIQMPVELRFKPDEVTDNGKLEINKQAQQKQISREKYALEEARTSSSENPRLFNVLAAPADALIIEPCKVRRFFDKDLGSDENQRYAVERALGTQDIFLIQGPPGTGKTTVITELILQILEREHNARILISSQSNIAVDNVLVKLGKAREAANLPESLRERLRIVRIGREENIDVPAQVYRAEQAVLEWQYEAANRSADYWEKQYSDQKADLLGGAEKLKQLGKLANHVEMRDVLSQRLVEAATQAAAAYTPALHTVFEQQAFVVDEIVWEKIQAEEKLRQEIGIYTERYGVKIPEQDRPINEWLTAEATRVDELLGEDGKHLKQFESLQMLQQQWIENLQRSQADLMELFLENVQVLGATCSKVGAYNLKDLSFDWVIIDEAGRATPAETLVAAVKGKRIVLVGDHKQLPPVVDHDFVGKAESELELTRKDLEESLFEYLYRALPETNKITLRHQYRMHPGIGELVGKLFYEEEGLSSERVSCDDRSHRLSQFSCPVYWISTGDARPREQMFHRKVGTSFCNPYEAEVINCLLHLIQIDCISSNLQKEVGVITAYASQKSTIERSVEPGNKEKWKHLNISVHTVDAFQGKDCDIVIFDVVRSHSDGKLGFTADYRRLNVALSRAKQLLFIVGNDFMAYRGKVKDGENPFRPLIDYIQEQDNCKTIKSQEVIDKAKYENLI